MIEKKLRRRGPESERPSTSRPGRRSKWNEAMRQRIEGLIRFGNSSQAFEELTDIKPKRSQENLIRMYMGLTHVFQGQ